MLNPPDAAAAVAEEHQRLFELQIQNLYEGRARSTIPDDARYATMVKWVESDPAIENNGKKKCFEYYRVRRDYCVVTVNGDQLLLRKSSANEHTDNNGKVDIERVPRIVKYNDLFKVKGQCYIIFLCLVVTPRHHPVLVVLCCCRDAQQHFIIRCLPKIMSVLDTGGGENCMRRWHASIAILRARYAPYGETCAAVLQEISRSFLQRKGRGVLPISSETFNSRGQCDLVDMQVKTTYYKKSNVAHMASVVALLTTSFASPTFYYYSVTALGGITGYYTTRTISPSFPTCVR